MKNRLGFFGITLICAAVFSVLVVRVFAPEQKAAIQNAANEESVYDRVMRTGTLKCGYLSDPPSLFKDPNTGQISGIVAEVMERAGAALQLRIEWSEEVTWGTMVEGVNNDRYDAVCAGIWENATRGRVVDFSTPLFYSAVNAYVRADDDRFKTVPSLNAPTVRIATIDGEMADMIARSSFAQAQRLALPQGSELSQMLLNVSTGKADVAFVETAIAEEFLKHNPGQLKALTPGKPLRVFANTIIFKQGQQKFKSMIDSAFMQLINSGDLDELIAKYQSNPGDLYPIADPYKTEKQL